MLQFFKKTGRKRSEGTSSADENHPNNTGGTNKKDDILLAAEQYFSEIISNDSTSTPPTKPHPCLSKNVLQIINDKNSLSYFVQFLDSHGALPLIKFWLDAESFKTAAELSCSSADLSTSSNNFTNTQKNSLTKSRSLDASVGQTTHCADVVVDASLQSLCESDEETFNYCSDKSMTQDENNICDMAKPLTDDEKTQLCEQSNILKQNLKNKQESQGVVGKKRNHFQSSLASDAIRIFKKYFTEKSTHFIELPATILSTISLALCAVENHSTDADNVPVISTLFVDAQHFVVVEHFEHLYLNQFIESTFYCKYCVDVLTGKSLKICDILYCEAALFYFMEFLEQESHRQYLDFWVAAINFKKDLETNAQPYDQEQAQSDALLLYEKYFSLQATCSLQMADWVRFRIEENICSELGPITNCFDLPIDIIERYLEQKYFKQFQTSQLFFKYLSELLHKIDGKPENGKTSGPATQQSSNQRKSHRKTSSDCSNESAAQFRKNTFISTQNTLLAMECPKKSITRSASTSTAPATSDMQIDSRHLYNPDLLWRRNSIAGLSFGRVDALGRYERDFDLEPIQNEPTVATAGSRFKQAVRKLVNLPEDRVQEEIAWQMAEMIVKDITAVTLNKENHKNSTNDVSSDTNAVLFS